jgi:Domain of Unknown Function (DUF1080).
MKCRFLLPMGTCAVLLFVALSCFSFSMAQSAEKTKADDKKWTLMFDGEALGGWAVSKLEIDKKPVIENGLLILGRNGMASGVKYENYFPKSNYEIMYQAKRAKGYDFFGALTFPVKESHCSFINGGWGGFVTGISSINGYDASENETTGFYDFKTDQWYQFRVRVCDERITVWFYPIDDPTLTDDEKAEREAEKTKKTDPKEEAEKREEIENPKINLELEDKELSTRIEVSPYRPLGLTTWETEGYLRDIKFRELDAAEIEAIKNEIIKKSEPEA